VSFSYCEAYGDDNPVAFGGFLDVPVTQAQICKTKAIHRFRWVCEHGHRGTIVNLCEQHWREFTGSPDAPWNVRRDVRACPRCASQAPSPEEQHKCRVRLVSVS
jgi:hypothetical protein